MKALQLVLHYHPQTLEMPFGLFIAVWHQPRDFQGLHNTTKKLPPTHYVATNHTHWPTCPSNLPCYVESCIRCHCSRTQTYTPTHTLFQAKPKQGLHFLYKDLQLLIILQLNKIALHSKDFYLSCHHSTPKQSPQRKCPNGSNTLVYRSP